MQGLIDKEDSLRKSLSSVRTVMNDHVYRKATDAEGVAASLQAEARRIVSSTGMEVTNSQVLAHTKAGYVRLHFGEAGSTGAPWHSWTKASRSSLIFVR